MTAAFVESVARPSFMASPAEVRAAVRKGFSGVTSGLAPGFFQGNLVVLPASWASAFVEFCRLNSGPLPVMAVSAPGDPSLPALGEGIDVRCDLGGYQLWKEGRVERCLSNAHAHWREDAVAVVLGCWFSNEAGLKAAGVRMRHLELGIQGGLFRTDRTCVPAGPFQARLVVSMRPFLESDVDRVFAYTSNMPLAHGAPIYGGNAAGLGISDWNKPDWGESLAPEEGETALCWGCGLTAFEALRLAGVPEFLSHMPGRMLVTDVPCTPSAG
jgi:uncharacterized protein YcsI (UPF0317 family)